MSWQRFRIVRQIHARPRLMTATAVALTVAILVKATAPDRLTSLHSGVFVQHNGTGVAD